MMADKLGIIEADDSVYVHLKAEHTGYYSLNVKLSSNTDWAAKGKESCLVEVCLHISEQVNGKYYVVTYMGMQQHEYTINLGMLQAGTYEVAVRNVPVCNQSQLYLHDIQLSPIVLNEQTELVYQHAPFLYGRNHFTQYDNCYTDTPLALMYSYELNQQGQIQIDYEFVFSHEDEGTPGKLLMAKWGRITDIEWCYTVTLNPDNYEVIERSYQGPEHEYRLFQGEFLPNSQRPILQVRTTNGNFDHIIDSDYCFSLHPTIHWKKKSEPRELYMKERPDINMVMVKEAERQLLNHQIEEHRIAHPTQYIYAFLYTEPIGDEVIDFVYKKDDGSFASSSYDFYDPVFGYGSYSGGMPNFTIAVNIQKEQIPDLQLRLLQGEEIAIQKIEFCSLNQKGELQEIYLLNEAVVVTKNERCVSIKERIHEK